jgi:hypothetical protein
MSTNYVLITTLSHFKLKYAIPEAAFAELGFSEPIDQQKLLELINSGKFKEFSQTHLGEVLADVSQYTQEDMLAIFNEDNDYLSDWTTDKKVDYLDKWDEEET